MRDMVRHPEPEALSSLPVGRKEMKPLTETQKLVADYALQSDGSPQLGATDGENTLSETHPRPHNST